MCVSPVTIYNNSHWLSSLDHFDVKRKVPCGICWQCQSQKQQEYAVRGYYEYLECLKDFGYVYWDTLTYSDEHLNYAYQEYFNNDFPCFLKDDVQRFMKRVRKHLSKDGFADISFRYLCVSEYGERFGRPHYHVMFFVHGPLPLDELHRVIRYEWRRFHGNTDFHCEPKGRVLTSVAAIHYVTKYISKLDVRLQKLYSKVSNAFSSRGLDVPTRRELNAIFQPWQLHSLGFGSYLFDCVDNGFNPNTLECVIPVSNNPAKSVPLPLYYLRARRDNSCILGLYDVVELPDPETGEIKRAWQATEKFAQIRLSLSLQRLKDLILSLTNKINNIDAVVREIQKHRPEIIDDLFGDYSFIEGWQGHGQNSASSFISSWFDSRDIGSLALYALDNRHRYSVTSESSRDVIYSRLNNVYPKKINPLIHGTAYDIEKNREFYSFNSETNRAFDIVLNFIDKVYSIYGDIVTESEIEKRLVKLEVKGCLPLAYKAIY